jgi:hypothetical protein
MADTFDAKDDHFHFAEMGDHWWATETMWFSFASLEHRLAGRVYMMCRPNIGTCAGGIWLFNDAGWSPWDLPYCVNYSSMPLQKGADLADILLPSGVRVQAVSALTEYRIEYSDDPHLSVDLVFRAIMPPFGMRHAAPPFAGSGHFDQLGHITGNIILAGQSIEIDCLSMRDRSWGIRREDRPRRVSYLFGVASPELAFHCGTRVTPEHEAVTYGFLLRDGKLLSLVGGQRRVERDETHGWVKNVELDGTDVAGRTFHAEGSPLSRCVVNHTGAVIWGSLMRWKIDGTAASGEDHDIWPLREWAQVAASRQGAGH